MKNKLQKICVFVLCGILLFACACTKKKTETPTDPGEKEDKVTTTYLVKDGASQYRIVIPENSGSTINTAANELQFFFSEATGVTLPIVRDNTIDASFAEYNLSIGKTTLFTHSGITPTYDELGEDGIKLVTKQNTVLMCGYGDNGAMFAMYEFLERQFNLEVYAEDEYYIDTNVQNLFLKEFDVSEKPVFARRSVGLYPYSVNGTFRNRMRQELYNDGWIYWSHSHFRILPKEVYGEHTDWYSPDGKQLCLTNDEMRAEFTRVVIELVKANPDCGYIMLGQEDVNTFCDCPRCAEQTAIYNNSGVMMHFINKVADDVQAYIDEHEPGRIFYVCTFGYQATQNAPVKYQNGAYEPIDDTVLPHDNVMVMVAPIYACNSHNYYDECNVETAPVLRGWKAVADKHLFVWMYNKIFNNYFIPFNNFSTIIDNYKILQDMGVYFVYHQGNKETAAGGMQELMCYVEAKLMWDADQNFEALVSDFITHYYKDAAPYYQEYYDLIRLSYGKWDAGGLHCYNSTSKSSLVFSDEYWTQDLLDKFEGLFDQMLASVEKYKGTNDALYETLVKRIKKERLTVRYLYLELHFGALSYDEAKEMIDDFEASCNKSGITVWREMYLSASVECLITNIVSKWRTALSLK